MTTDDTTCNDGENDSQMTCRTCGYGAPVLYWCETCQQQTPDKRCPGCGLKTRKVRHPGQK